jgi:23S rRNA pseudouridine1911/1915/1917 synthase
MSESPRTVSMIVGEPDAGERADVVLGRQIPGLSRRRARSLALAGNLRVDGQRRPPSTRVRAGERLELTLDDLDAPAQLDTLDVIAETDSFIYVGKPAGVHTVALTPDQPGVLATAVAARFPECATASPDPREGGAVHRLDHPTSGVVAFARSREIWLAARAAFAAERVRKHYLAVSVLAAGRAPTWPPDLPDGGLRGWIEPAEHPLEHDGALSSLLDAIVPTDARMHAQAVRIRAPLGNDGPTRSRVSLDGRRTTTLVLPIARVDDRQLSYLALETGRRHQARVHLAWIGWPIRKDSSYGPGATDGEPPASIDLHAVALDLSAAFPAERPVLAKPPRDFWA